MVAMLIRNPGFMVTMGSPSGLGKIVPNGFCGHGRDGDFCDGETREHAQMTPAKSCEILSPASKKTTNLLRHGWTDGRTPDPFYKVISER